MNTMSNYDGMIGKLTNVYHAVQNPSYHNPYELYSFSINRAIKFMLDRTDLVENMNGGFRTDQHCIGICHVSKYGTNYEAWFDNNHLPLFIIRLRNADLAIGTQWFIDHGYRCTEERIGSEKIVAIRCSIWSNQLLYEDALDICHRRST